MDSQNQLPTRVEVLENSLAQSKERIAELEKQLHTALQIIRVNATINQK